MDGVPLHSAVICWSRATTASASASTRGRSCTIHAHAESQIHVLLPRALAIASEQAI